VTFQPNSRTENAASGNRCLPFPPGYATAFNTEFNFNLFVYSRHEVHSMNTHTL